MSANNNKDERATIAELIAKNGSDEVGFFRRRPAYSDEHQQDSSTPALVPVMQQLLEADMLVPGSSLGPNFYDDYRRIKRPLLSNAFGKAASLVDQGNLILVTSSLPGEGKTHTAVNLALSIAQERDHTVLLVDCDVTRKGVSHMLGVADRAGLVDVIEDENLGVGDVLLSTDIQQFRVLAAGKQNEFVTELLASQRMSRIINELISRYDDRIIIFDGPPLLSTPQTQVLAGLVGQVVFVIEAGKTPQSIVEEAVEMIPKEKAIGIVMNKSEGISERKGYYYGYYGSRQDNSRD